MFLLGIKVCVAVWFGLEFLFAVRFACGEVGKLLSARFNFGMVFV